MARANGSSENVGGFAFQMKSVVVVDVFRSLNDEGEPSPFVYLTVKSKDGSEVKFNTDQIKPEQDEQLFGAKVSLTGFLKGRRYQNQQTLQTVGALQIAEPIA